VLDRREPIEIMGEPERAQEPDFLLHCAGGHRSSIAASILQQHGLTRVLEMWGSRGLECREPPLDVQLLQEKRRELTHQ
jgi:rhodanese-related sulfurtransferase